MHRCSPLMKEIMLNSKYNKEKSDRSHEELWPRCASRGQAKDVERLLKKKKEKRTRPTEETRELSRFIIDVATYRNGKLKSVLG